MKDISYLSSAQIVCSMLNVLSTITHDASLVRQEDPLLDCHQIINHPRSSSPEWTDPGKFKGISSGIS